MEVTLRLQRFGAKRQPSYRLVATTRAKANKGDCLENLGSYNPRTEPSTIRLKGERVAHWLSVGAKPSATVRRLLVEVKRREKQAKKA